MPSRWSARRAAYRTLLGGDTCIYPASVHDPVTARIATHIGFELGMLAGSTGSLAVLGAPDLILLTLTEFAEQALRVSRAAELPLMTDADHGYGNALNVMRTVEELEQAGVAGLSIEDTLLPTRYGAADKTELLSVDEGVGKMMAALAGRRDPALVIAGRTSAPMATDMEDCIRRAVAYQGTGVDAIFLVGIRTLDQVKAVREQVHLPLILGPTPEPVMMDRAGLSALGVRVMLQGHQPIPAAVQATHDVLRALRDGAAPSSLKGLAGKELMEVATRSSDYARWTRDWLGGKA
ncbi:MAG: isocitrate lyase/PEP mutase family protein [Hyphomicrobiaceae bacterium]